MRRHTLIGVASFIALAIIACVVSVFHFSNGMRPPYDRADEKLPTITIEAGNIIYCRMQYCDFRFPLPGNVRIVMTNIESGGSDTINGTVCVTGMDGKPVNLRIYAEFLQKEHWNVNVVSGVGCDACTNVADEPFINAGKTIHYPLFGEISGSSEHCDGGTFEVKNEGATTKIHVAYFGDY